MRRLAAALVAMLALVVAAWAQKTAPVTVTILPTSPNTYRASILFPTALGEKAASATVSDLVRRAGWSISDPAIATTPAQGRFPAQTSVEFTVTTLFPNGQFPVEPFAVAFRQWGDVNVMFAHGGSFQYKGQPRYDSPDATIDANATTASFNLRIHVKNKALQRLTLAPPMEAPRPPAAHRRAWGFGVWVVFAATVAIAAYVVTYVLASRRQHA